LVTEDADLLTEVPRDNRLSKDGAHDSTLTAFIRLAVVCDTPDSLFPLAGVGRRALVGVLAFCYKRRPRADLRRNRPSRNHRWLSPLLCNFFLHI
jgi:hypothetical protein